MGKIEKKFLEMLIFLHLENKCRISKEDIDCFLHKIHVFFSLTVLLKPSPPRILPIAPTFTEGTPVNLTCSSIGGSPPPQVIPPTISVTLGKTSDINRNTSVNLTVSEAFPHCSVHILFIWVKAPTFT